LRVLSVLIIGAVYATQAALPWLAREQLTDDWAKRWRASRSRCSRSRGLGAGLLCPWSEKILRIFGPHIVAAAGSCAGCSARRPRSMPARRS
jgi:hypothetical protein